MQLIKESFGSSKRLLVLLLVACVVLAEVQSSLAQAADSASETSSSAGAKSKSKSASKRVKAPKIRRTIRLVEQPPQVDESVEEAAAEPVEAQPQAPQNIELKNEGPSNHVDVKPSISIGAPTIPTVELPDDEADEQQDKESKLQIVPYEPAAGNKLDQVIGSSNDQVALTMNSGNQQMDLGAHNNNLNSRLLQNSGNTEQLHIDGVGNNKITRISNVGNTEEQHIEHAANRQVAASLPQQQVPTVAAGLPLGPLVQISMNNVEPIKQTAAFGVVAPPSFNLVAPQLDGQLAMWQPSVAQQVPIFNSLVAPQMMAMMMQQQQQPIMPMWLAGPPMTPHDFRRMLRASAEGDIHHHHHHHHHEFQKSTTQNVHQHHHHHHHHRLAEPLKPSESVKSATDKTTTESDDGELLVVSLDTKVPHPASEFSGRLEKKREEVEEVSYYNEAAAASITNLLEPKQAGGSLDNNTRPRLLAAVDAAGRQSHHQIHQQHHQHQQHQHHDQFQQQQQRSQASLVATSASCQHLLRHNPYINDDQQELADEFENNLQLANQQDDDDDLLRYDNAQVERNLRQNERRLLATTMCHQRHQQHQHQHLQQQQQQQNQQQQRQQQQVSISTSPKAKSAPATPCNVTPTASANCASSLIANSNCNTLPPDIRKNILAAAAATSECQQVSLKYLDNLAERGERALFEKDYQLAVDLLSQCINPAIQHKLSAYLKKNFKIYIHRAEAHLKLANYNEAIDDSIAARDLNPKLTQAYYLQCQAQFCINQYADALAVLAYGLTETSPQIQSSGATTPPGATTTTANNLFEVLIEAASRYSPNGFKVKLAKLKALKLEAKPFIVLGLLGQELFEMGHCEHAAIVLESALKINNLEMATATNNHSPPPPPLTGNSRNQQRKFERSVLSTISAAYCKLHDYDKALNSMQLELKLETELEDVAGQCRVLANLGYAHFKARAFDKSLELHRKQMDLALRQHLFQEASQAFSALGHVHAARNNFTDALTSHERCLVILKQLGDNRFNQLREILAIGHLHSQLADLKAAAGSYNEALQLLNDANSSNQLTSAQRDECTLASIMLDFNLAYLALKRQNYPEAEQHYNSVLKLAKSLNSSSKTESSSCTTANQASSVASRRQLYEMRAANGLGQTCRLLKRFDEAQCWFEKQLKLAQASENQLGQSQALCNLGMIRQHFKDYQRARRLFEDNLKLVDKSPELKAYAHSYLGSNYFLLNLYNESRFHYETSLSLFRQLAHCRAERKTIELNLALVQERLSGTLNVAVNQQTPETLLHPATSAVEPRPNVGAAKSATHAKKVMMSAS